MLNNAFEWERLVHPNPTDEMVTRRKSIVASILTSFDSKKDVNEATRVVSAAMAGLSPTIQADIEYATKLTEATRALHQAFPSQLIENAVDLQLTACLVVGEILTRKATKGTWRDPVLAIAALCVSSSRFQPKSTGKHLRAVHECLTQYSIDLLARQALVVRKRPDIDLSDIDELAPTADVPEFWKQLKPVLKAALEGVTQASEIDRDELEVLWWLYNDDSSIFKKSFSSLNAFEAAFSASLELVDRALCPAPSSLKGIIASLVLRAGGKAKPAAKAIKSLVAEWTPEVIGAIASTDDDIKAIAKSSPKVLPMTWIATKVAESGVTSGWESEFENRSGISSALKITPDAFADQVFIERTAQRLLLPLTGE